MPLQPFYVNSVLAEPDALRISGTVASRRIEPKVMSLLVALSEQPGQLWTRDALVDRLWSGESASDEVLTRLVYQLRKALKDVGAVAGVVQTVPKLGYRLDAEVQAADVTVHAPATSASQWPAFSVAVLPVEDASVDQDGWFLAEGLTRDLTMLLSRTPRFRVAPYSSAARFSFDESDINQISQELQSRFLVAATSARVDDSVSIRVELSDVAEGVVLWSDKYQTTFDRFFEVEQDVVCAITTSIATKVNVVQPARARRTGRFNLSAYERVQVAEALRANYGRETAVQIVGKLREALEIEPDDPITRSALAVQLSQNVVSQWEDDPEATISEADTLIARALREAPNDPEVRAGAGIVSTMFCRPDDAIVHLEIATARNPNDAHAMAVLGWQLCLRHSDPGGIGLIETAEARAPHHPRFGLWATYRATAHLFMLNYAEGLVGALQAVERTPNYYQPHLTCAWAHTGLGDAESARRQIAKAKAMESGDIFEKYAQEMRRWSDNSPNSAACHAVLNKLASLNES